MSHVKRKYTKQEYQELKDARAGFLMDMTDVLREIYITKTELNRLISVYEDMKKSYWGIVAEISQNYRE